MTLNQLICRAASVYPDAYPLVYWDQEVQEPKADPFGGDTLAQFVVQELADTFDLRVLLEGYAAEQAAQRADADQIHELDALAGRMREAAVGDDSDRLAVIAEMNSRFHRAILELSGNSRLISVYEIISQVPVVYRTFHRYSTNQLIGSMDHHLELVDALRHRDPAWAGSVR